MRVERLPRVAELGHRLRLAVRHEDRVVAKPAVPPRRACDDPGAASLRHVHRPVAREAHDLARQAGVSVATVDQVSALTGYSRADVVAAIPVNATGVLTLWTEDFSRTGQGYPLLPTVPVAHFRVNGMAASVYTISAGTPRTIVCVLSLSAMVSS